MLRALTALLATAFVLVAMPATARTVKAPAEVLPDLAQDVPSQISVQQVPGPNGTEFRLGFRSAVRNIGRGRLIVHGHRRRGETQMRADQLVELSNGHLRRYRRVLRMRYAWTPTHNHFHVLRFDQYSLRDATTGARVADDHKSGFCLGDRKEVDRPRIHPPPYYGPPTGECAWNHPEAREVIEGLTPGYLDDYGPQLEGQYIDVTSVPAGRYSLVHRVNADHSIRERNGRNDVAAALIELAWPSGPQQPPAVRVLATCRARTLCNAPASARAAAAVRPVPVVTALEVARRQLWCSVRGFARP
jgi:hypothetical protein